MSYRICGLLKVSVILVCSIFESWLSCASFVFLVSLVAFVFLLLEV